MIHIKRPILIAVIGYIIGILWGLYFEFSIVLFYFPIIVIFYIIKKLRKIFIKKRKNEFKLISIRRYFRYIKIFFKSNVIYLIIVISIISNTIVIFQNRKYDNLYKDKENVNILGIIVSDKQEKEYKYVYKIKVICNNNSNKYTNTYLLIKINKKQNVQLQYGDKVLISGGYIQPEIQRNYKGFDYKKYLKSIKVYGTINVKNIKVISNNNLSPILNISNNISNKIKNNIQEMMDNNFADIFKGLLLGEKDKIDEEIQEDFRIGNISHVLVVSGMHIAYILLGINIIFEKILGKRNTRILVILILILYMFITGFSPSVIRAGIMGILVIFSGLVFRKNDIWNSIAISLFVILLYNPYLITSVGLQLSYIGTIGIIILNKNIYNLLKKLKIKNKKIKYRINRKIILAIDNLRKILSVTLAAQIMVLPIMLNNFNIFGTYFIITNLLVSLIIGPLIIIGFICIIISFLNIQVAKFFSIAVVIGIKLLILISDISKLPLSKIYLPTPQIYIIIIYYILIILFNYLYPIFDSINLTITQVRIKNLIALAKYKFNQKKKKYINMILILLTILFIFNCIPRNLKIHFVDVGQGDCTFIETQYKKTILIDGGGSLSKEFDVGKSTLLPYVLNRGYTKIDYIIISHFDQDHVGGVLTIMEELKVGKVIIAKQGENSENYQKFKEIVNEKKIKVIVVKKRRCNKYRKRFEFSNTLAKRRTNSRKYIKQ